MKFIACVRHALIVSSAFALALGCSSSKKDDDGESDGSHEPATCEGFVNRYDHFCPRTADERATEIMACEDDRRDFASVGCTAAYDAWLGCGARATWDCEYGPAGCDDEQNGYFTCLSQFVQRTGCTYTAPQSSCPTEKPNTFGCLTAKPPYDTCVPVPDNTGSANLYCCE